MMTTAATSLSIKEMKLNSTTCAFGTITQTLRSSRVQTKYNKHILVMYSLKQLVFLNTSLGPSTFHMFVLLSRDLCTVVVIELSKI